MDFHITGLVPVEKTPLNCFMVEIRTTEAENGQPSFIVGPIPQDDKERLQSLVETLRRMQQHHEDGGDERGYEEVFGFMQWFQGGYTSFDDLRNDFPDLVSPDHTQEEYEVLYKLVDGASENWPYDPRSDDMISEKLSRYDVYYYDNAGLKFNVLCQP